MNEPNGHERERRKLTLRDSAGWLLALGLAAVTLVSNYSANATRLTVMEKRVEVIEDSAVQRPEMTDVKQRLERIENKLDRLADERAERRKNR